VILKVHPANAAKNVPVYATRDWSDVPQATSYNLYLWRAGDSGPSTPTAAGLKVSQYTRPAALRSPCAPCRSLSRPPQMNPRTLPARKPTGNVPKTPCEIRLRALCSPRLARNQCQHSFPHPPLPPQVPRCGTAGLMNVEIAV